MEITDPIEGTSTSENFIQNSVNHENNSTILRVEPTNIDNNLPNKLSLPKEVASNPQKPIMVYNIESVPEFTKI